MDSSNARKATFMIPGRILAEIREAVDAGLAVSASALVRDALQRRLRDLNEERLRRTFEQAAADPLFLKDTGEIMVAFQGADAESAALIPDE